jgi:hypothetical protein
VITSAIECLRCARSPAAARARPLSCATIPGRPAAVDGHGTLQRRGPEVSRDLDRVAEPGGVDAGLRGFLDNSADQEGQFQSAVEDQDAVIGQRLTTR